MTRGSEHLAAYTGDSSAGLSLRTVFFPWQVVGPGHLSPDHFEELFRVACAMKLDLRRRAIDLSKVLGAQVNVYGLQVLVQAMRLRRPRDRHDPGLLREQPGQRELRRGRAFPLREGLQPVHEGQIGLAVLLSEPRHGVAKVG